MLKLTIFFAVFRTVFMMHNFTSPCPELFKYEAQKANDTDRWYGTALLTTEVVVHDGIWLVLVFDGPSIEVVSPFANVIFKLKDTEYLLKTLGIKLIPNEHLPVRFYVRYDPKKKIPELKGFRINTRPSCPDSKYVATTPSPIEKFEEFEANLFTKNDVTTYDPSLFALFTSEAPKVKEATPAFNDEEFIINPDSDSDFFPGDIAFTPMQEMPNMPNVQAKNRNVRCGTVVRNAGNGRKSSSWPWHVVLYNFIGTQIMYTCGGTLISEKHVITAAHCVTKPKSKTPISLDLLSVFLGKQSLKSFGNGVQLNEVSEMFVHPSYNFNVLYNDIAVLTLAHAVEFTEYVRPVCLWQDFSLLNPLYNQLGTVVGYGFDTNRQLSHTLMSLNMPIVRTEDCLRKGGIFPKVMFEKNYCAGFKNETSVCSGDSGGGMVFPKPDPEGSGLVWYLRGFVSIGVALQGQYVCNEQQHVVFTDVAKYLDWIKLVTATN